MSDCLKFQEWAILVLLGQPQITNYSIATLFTVFCSLKNCVSRLTISYFFTQRTHRFCADNAENISH